MNIELSKNKPWQELQPELDHQKIDRKLDDAWNQWTPAFVTDYIRRDELKKITEWANHLKKKIDYLIVIGMGGSSLGAKAIQQYGFQNHHKLLFWEGTHPSLLKKYSKILEKQKAALLWISKSGTTLESRANLATVREFFDDCPEYFVTSYPDQVADLCADSSKIFKIPENLGGRFSVISPVGIMPSSFIDADTSGFFDGFCRANDEYHISSPIEENQAKKTAHELFSLLTSGFYGVVFWVYSRELLGWGDWMVQLWGESIGKDKHIEVLPYLAKGPEDQHSLLQFFQEGPNKYVHIFCHTKSYAPYNAKLSEKHSGNFANHTLWEILQAQMRGIECALTEAERPITEYLFPQLYKDNMNDIRPDMELMGKWMGYWMYVVAYVGYLYEVNPFDQPGVEKGKQYCNEILTKFIDKTPFVVSVDI